MTSREALVWRLLTAAGAIVFALLTVAAFRHPSLGWAGSVLATLGVVTLIRPAIGLMLAAGVLPIVPALRLVLGVESDEPTLLFLVPFLAAALLRLTIARSLPLGRLRYPALALAAIVFGDAVARLNASTPDGLVTASFAAGVWRLLSADYFTHSSSFDPYHLHVGWIAGIALAVIVEAIMRHEPRVRFAVVRLAITSAAGLAIFSVNRVAEVALRSVEPLSAAISVMGRIRFSPFYTDINAAGSLYVLFAVPPLWRALATRGYGYWAAAIPLCVALWLSGSRTALLAAPAGLLIAWLLARPLRGRAVVVGLVIVMAAATAATFVTSRVGQAGPGTAVDIRIGLLGVAARVAAIDPVFGVGLGRFRPASAEFITPGLAQRFPESAHGENAHNNFLQILAELGIFGLGAFAWLLATPLAGAIRTRGDRVMNVPALVGGLAAFAITCLGGHPMLSGHVRWAFFLVLGLSAGLPGSGELNERPGRATAVTAALVLFVLASLPFRF